jgi:integrase/recombinase XerD
VLVNLKKRVKIKGQWTYIAVPRKNGRFMPERVSAPGTFYIEWRQDGKRHQEKVGANPRIALDHLHHKQEALDSSKVAPSDPEQGMSIADACETFLKDVKATRSDATHRTYAVQTKWFLKRTTKSYVSEVDRDEVMRLFAAGREEGSDQKTINKRIVVVLGVLRNAGQDIRLRKGDWPKTATPDPEVFETDELKKFFAACDDRELTLFMTFLLSGFRFMEVATLQWSGDIDFRNKTLKVRIKPELSFTPKSYESRSVRVPEILMTRLRDWKKQSKGDLVFPTLPHPKRKNYGGDAIDYHMLEECKEIAFRAGLNCKRCNTAQGKCKEGPHCDRWFLHKWRHTFATNMLRSGVDIKSLQTLLGHKSLATTEKYLKSLRLHDLEQKVENSTLASMLRAG